MELLLTILERYGLATAFLALTCVVGWKILSEKMKEIKGLTADLQRVNEARVREQHEGNQRLLLIVQEFNELQRQQQTTLTLIAERLDQ